MRTITFPIQECKRCGNEWVSRVKIPVQCPRCKSAFWNKPRIREINKEKKK